MSPVCEQGEGAETNSPSDSLTKQYSCNLLTTQHSHTHSQEAHNKRVSRIQKGQYDCISLGSDCIMSDTAWGQTVS